MAEITQRRLGELLQGVFRILMDHPEGLAAKDVLRRLANVVSPTPFEQSTYPNHPNVRRYEKIVRFSTVAAVKAGWLIKNKGSWYLTDEGRAAFARFQDPEQLAREATRLYRQWQADQSAEDAANTGDDASRADAATTVEEAEEAAWAEIETFLRQMSPYDFQELVAGLLRGMGYHIDWVAPPGPDSGIDIVAHVDPLGVNGPRIKVQVKRWAEKVSVAEIRSFVGTLGDADVGVFVSTGGFTREAESAARHQEKRRVMLLDLKRLFDLWVEHYDRIPEENRRLLPLRVVYYLAPDE